MIEMNERFNAERLKREKERDDKAPICDNSILYDEHGNVLDKEECKTKTYYDKKCSGFVCPECNTHYSTLGGRMRFCWCGWNKQNFDPMDAGERWDSDY